MQAFHNKIVNLNLGLSPFHRGGATLFWPFVNRELQYMGTTIHLAVAKVEAGAIIKRVNLVLKTSESYYEIKNRLIRNSIDQFLAALENYLLGQIKPYPFGGRSTVSRHVFSYAAEIGHEYGCTMERGINYLNNEFNKLVLKRIDVNDLDRWLNKDA